MLTDDEFDRLCRRLYRSLRDGAVDREAAFDVSAEVLAYHPANEKAAEAAALALTDDPDPAPLAAAVRELLASLTFAPGFDDEPGWLAALEEALEIVKADLRACGLPDTVRLYTWDGSPNAAVDAWAANSSGGGIYPAAGQDPVTALVAVADDAQDAVMHSVWGAWPTCPEHSLGVHALEHGGAAVWWCGIGGGHVVARVGQWPRATPPPRLVFRAIPFLFSAGLPGCGCRQLPDERIRMSDSPLSQALQSTLVILTKVRPDDLAAPTPCASWDVRALINHFVGTPRWWAAVISGQEAAADADYAAGDFVAAYEESSRIAVAAFAAEGALDKTVRLPFGEFSGTVLRDLAAMEQFTHGWDLSRATGYGAGLEPELAAGLLAKARLVITDEYRGPDGEALFGPALAAKDGAGPADQLAAFLGRQV